MTEFNACRAFWSNSYAEIKHLNPRFPFMIRPLGRGDPYILFEYGERRVVWG
jgi:hypothetical protein